MLQLLEIGVGRCRLSHAGDGECVRLHLRFPSIGVSPNPNELCKLKTRSQ